MADTHTWTGAISGDWSEANNWDIGAVPEATDSVVLIDNAVSITEGLDQSAIALVNVHIDASYTGTIGTTGSYLQLDADITYIGRQDGVGPFTGSSQLKLDFGANSGAIYVFSTATRASGNPPPVIIKAANNGATLSVYAGSVGVATNYPGDTTTLQTVNVGQYGGAASAAEVILASGTTTTSVVLYSGTAYAKGTHTGITMNDGVLTLDSVANLTTVAIYGGTAYLDGWQTITTLTMYGGSIDTSRRHPATARQITNTQIYKGVTSFKAYSAMANDLDIKEALTLTAVKMD